MERHGQILIAPFLIRMRLEGDEELPRLLLQARRWNAIFSRCVLIDFRRNHKSLTPWLTGAGSRRLEGTNISHENAEGMAYVGVRVEPTVRLGSGVEAGCSTQT